MAKSLHEKYRALITEGNRWKDLAIESANYPRSTMAEVRIIGTKVDRILLILEREFGQDLC